MNNRGPLPIEINEPDSGTPPIPCRYVMIYLEKFNTRTFSQNRRGTSQWDDCTIPIEKKQVPACLANATPFSELKNFDEIVRARPFVHLAKEILHCTIFGLDGWDLVGYVHTITPKPEPTPMPKPESKYAPGFGPGQHEISIWHGTVQDEDREVRIIDVQAEQQKVIEAERAGEGVLVMVARIWAKGPSDRLLKPKDKC